MKRTYTTPILTKERIQQERLLIARALTCIPSALTIADVLIPANFRDEFCKQLFDIILHSTDTMNLDLISITRVYNERYGNGHTYKITQLTEESIGSMHVMQEAVRLLEQDIREKFCELLSRMEKECGRMEEFEAAAIWKQAHDYMNHPAHDPLQSVEQLYAYLKSNFPNEIEEYTAMRESIPKIAERIRTRAKTRKYLDILTSLGSDAVSYEQQISIKILTDWLILCMSNLPLPDKFYETLKQLNSNWNV